MLKLSIIAYDVIINMFSWNIFFKNIKHWFVDYIYIVKTLYFAYVLIFLKNIKNNYMLLLCLFAGVLNYKNIIYVKQNIGLTNIMSFWHPLALYVSITFIIVFFKQKIKQNSVQTLQCVVLFAYTGAWWSSQELLWGGWWNWDGVENTIFVMLVIYAYVIHNNNSKYINKWLDNQTYCLLIILFIYVNKTSLFKSIHSFTNSTTNNINFLFIFVVVVLFVKKNTLLLPTFIYSVMIGHFIAFATIYLINNSIVYNNLNILKIIFLFTIVFCFVFKNKINTQTFILAFFTHDSFCIFTIIVLFYIFKYIKQYYIWHNMWNTFFLFFLWNVSKHANMYYKNIFYLKNNNMAFSLQNNYFALYNIKTNINNYFQKEKIINIFKNNNFDNNKNTFNSNKNNLFASIIIWSHKNNIAIFINTIVVWVFYISKRFFLIKTKKKLQLLFKNVHF